jgi:hypothetical protein
MPTWSGVCTWKDPALYNVAWSQTYPNIQNSDDWGNPEQLFNAGTVPIIHAMFKRSSVGWARIVKDIRDGDYDADINTYLDELVRLTDLGIKLLVAPYPEMNGVWTPYGPDRNNFHPEYGAEIFRQFVGMARAKGLDDSKVLWCWAPNNIGDGDIADYWPGSDVVTYVGGSVYNWGGIHANAAWQSPEELFDAYVADVRTFTNKPIIITQTGAGEGDSRTPQWLDDAVLYTLAPNKDIEGFVWFDVSEFTYQPGPADFNQRTAALDGAQPLYLFDSEPPITPPTVGVELPALFLYAGYDNRGRAYQKGAVMSLQALLKYHGFHDQNTTDPRCGIDGKMGPGTTTALKNFQLSRGMAQTGVTGIDTWTALYAGSI